MENENIICKKEVELDNEKYVVYLKEVPIRVKPGGEAKKKIVRAFIKKV